MRNVPLVFISVATTMVVLASYIGFRPPPPQAPPAEVQTPQLDSSHAYIPQWHPLPSNTIEWDLRYHVGMSRDQIRQGLPRNTCWLASVSRPDKGWRWVAPGKDEHGVAQSVARFEAEHPKASVAACDLFEADRTYHFLFFDDAGVLIGFERNGGCGVLFSESGQANQRAGVDARFVDLFAFGSQWLGTTQHARLDATERTSMAQAVAKHNKK